MKSSFKKDFPIFENRDFIYFDNASTTFKPKQVIDQVINFYTAHTSNVARGNNKLVEITSLAFEGVREKVATFIGSKKSEIVFALNGTDAINLLADGLKLNEEDEVILSSLEHHSACLPFIMKCKATFVNLTESGVIDLEHLRLCITKKTKLIIITYVSNVTGVVQPVEEVISIAKEKGVLTFVDAAQAASHFAINVSKLNCDFLTFSSHKMFGPSGVGVLFGRSWLLEKLLPNRFGGGMVNLIEKNNISFRPPPERFEAGTPNIEGILGFGAAIDYFSQQGWGSIKAKLLSLEDHFQVLLKQQSAIYSLFPMSDKHCPIFTISPRAKKISIYDISRILSDKYNIYVNVGYQCCQPLYKNFNLSGGIRISMHIYNELSEIELFFEAINDLRIFLQ